jgi:hypothetical protein
MKYWKFYTPTFDFYRLKLINPDPIKYNAAWLGHVFFAYDLVRVMRPKNIVELGTHWGHSFFAMCQAVKDGGLGTKLVAVDTWKGEPHSGFYDESVYNKVIEINRRCYDAQQVELIRSKFDEALTKVVSGSVDLLHIDGLHTYEAVKHDYDLWKEKVTGEGVILFHDVIEKDNNFGVYKLWEELKSQYIAIEFRHFHGLGVLLPLQSRLGEELKENEALLRHYYDSIATAFLSVWEGECLKDEVRVLATDIMKLNKSNWQMQFDYQQEIKKVASEWKVQVETRDAMIKNRDAVINDRDAVINDMQSSLFWKIRKIFK